MCRLRLEVERASFAARFVNAAPATSYTNGTIQFILNNAYPVDFMMKGGGFPRFDLQGFV